MELLLLSATNTSSCASTAPAISNPPRSVRSTASPNHRVPIIDASFLSERDRVTREVPGRASGPFTWVYVTRESPLCASRMWNYLDRSPPYQNGPGCWRAWPIRPGQAHPPHDKLAAAVRGRPAEALDRPGATGATFATVSCSTKPPASRGRSSSATGAGDRHPSAGEAAGLHQAVGR